MSTKALPVAGAMLFLLGSPAARAALNAPSNLEVYSTTTTSVSLVWTYSGSGEDGFRIYRSTDGSNYSVVDTSLFTSYQDNTVSEGVLYYYYVTAYNAGDESGPSNTITAVPKAPYVTVLTPDGGETLTIGSTYNVTWETNYPSLDPRIYLSTDGGATWPHIIQPSWGNNGSPFPWKVGYQDIRMTIEPPSPTVVWEQVVFSTETECKIWIEDYEHGADSDESDAVFTIEPDSGDDGPCGSGGAALLALFLLAAARRRK